MTRIYLDYNATTPLRAEALEAMITALREDWGNPSSVHWAGEGARAVIEKARAQVAALAGVPSDTLYFTSGATESNNTVLRSAALRAWQKGGAGQKKGAGQGGDQIVTCATEHPAVLDTSEELREQGIRVTVLPVETDGRVDLERFDAALGPNTLLASIMWVNNETGVIQPIPELSSLARKKGVPFHTDAVQALGKLELGLGELCVDYASFSAHKLGGPKGVGALYATRRFQPLLRGGPQERRRRPGTENVPGIVGFGAACAANAADLEAREERLGELRDRVMAGISAKIPDAVENGAHANRVPHTLNVSFPGADSEALVAALDLAGIAVASGAACASGSTEPSHVLLAMGAAPETSTSAIRISLGAETRSEELDHLLAVLPEVVARVRSA